MSAREAKLTLGCSRRREPVKALLQPTRAPPYVTAGRSPFGHDERDVLIVRWRRKWGSRARVPDLCYVTGACHSAQEGLAVANCPASRRPRARGASKVSAGAIATVAAMLVVLLVVLLVVVVAQRRVSRVLWGF